MFETLGAVAIAAGFVLFIRTLAGPETDDETLLRLFVSGPMPARPRGVQEMAPAPFASPDPAPADAPRIRMLGAPQDPARAA